MTCPYGHLASVTPSTPATSQSLSEVLDTACSELSTCVNSSQPSTSDSQELIQAQSVDDGSLLHAGQKRSSSIAGYGLSARTGTEQKSPGVEVYTTIYALQYYDYCLQVLVNYSSGAKQFEVTPTRKGAIVSLSKRNYRAAAKKVATSEKTSEHVISVITQQMREEMKEICSKKHNSMLRDSHEAVKMFSWETIWLELEAKLPIMFNFFQKLLPKAEKKFLAFLMSLILKKRCKHMSLVQRAISVVLYGNAAKKQVFVLVNIFIAFHL